MILIIGAGLSGLSCSYHLGHKNCILLEKHYKPYGHIGTDHRSGFVWDQGPHVSFTKNEYVRRLFAESVENKFDEYEVAVGNYYKGHWIDHPAQSSFHQIPEPLRTQCLDSFLKNRRYSIKEGLEPSNYMEWLEIAFGPTFAKNFPAIYTNKYWTRHPLDLTTDWIGNRVFYPSVEDVVQGSKGPLEKRTHYITRVRYPRKGGYQSFAHKLATNAQISYAAEVISIDLANRKVMTADGRSYCYEQLVNTIPLPIFIQACENAPLAVREAASALSCSHLLLVNAVAPHSTRPMLNWIYVYDEDKLSTRINCTEKLTPNNAPLGWTGVQVEVYFSRHRPLPVTPTEVGNVVQQELITMGIIDPSCCENPSLISHHLSYCPWANVIFDHDTRPALDTIWKWLEEFGLQREADDLHPLTNWTKDNQINFSISKLIMAGRFGQWKYYWSDDCVLRGKEISDNCHSYGLQS